VARRKNMVSLLAMDSAIWVFVVHQLAVPFVGG
jgi:hypothetical protein